MADFKTHITTSTILGIGYGAGAHFGLQMPLESCMLAAGLCSISGMLPDLDSDSGIPFRETVSITAAIVPMLMIDRFQHLGFSTESIVLAAGLIYIVIRFGVAEIFKRYTVHRGMWHSVPAAVIATLLAYLVCSCEDTTLRVFKAGGVFVGFMSHLVLDEMYAIEVKRGAPRIKKSFGTAIKFWGNSLWGNVSTYGKLVIIGFVAFGDPVWMESVTHELHQIKEDIPHTANQWIEEKQPDDDFTELR